MQKNTKLSTYQIIALFAIAKLIIHLLTNHEYGFHRDELLYLALGRHLDWGYMSVPPFISFLAWLSQNVLGDSVSATRFFPALAGTAIVGLIGLMTKEMGGGRFGVVLACTAALVTPAHLVPSTMFQPVVFDILAWTTLAFFTIKYINAQQPRYLWWLGIAAGIGLLNKYSVLFFLLGIFVGMALTTHRKLFTNRNFYISMGLTTLIVLPNVIWQIQHNLPVVTHMRELAESQFVYVSPVNFLIDQLTMHAPALLIWTVGLYALFAKSNLRNYRILGWIYLTVLLTILLLSGKSYYTLGAYPMLIAAGAVQWEHWLEKAKQQWLKPALVTFLVLLELPFLPLSLPILPIPKLVEYNTFLQEEIGFTGPFRWENGQVYPLQQDHADMLGWREIANFVHEAYVEGNCETKNCVIYCENYGQAGAVDLFGQQWNLPPAYSFSDTYKFWIPDNIGTFDTWIHVDTDPGDLPKLFEKIEVIGEIDHPYSRQLGVKVYLCEDLKPGALEFMNEKIASVKSEIE